MTELLTEQAFDLMFVDLAKAVGFATRVKLRCETKVAEYVTKCLQEKASGQGRDCEHHMPREGPCPMETELKECRDKIKKRNTPTTETCEVGGMEESTLVETGDAIGGGGERYLS